MPKRVRRHMIPNPEIAAMRAPLTMVEERLRLAGFNIYREYQMYESPAHDAVEFVQEVPDGD